MGLIAVSVSDQFRSQITIRSNALFTQMKQSGMMLFNSFWVNPDQTNLSPDKTWAAMGTDAVAARHAYLGMASFVNAVVAGSFFSLLVP